MNDPIPTHDPSRPTAEAQVKTPSPEHPPLPAEPTIEETSAKRLRWFHIVCLLLGLVVVHPLLVPLGVGLVLGFVSEGPLHWLERKLRVRRTVGRWALAAVFEFLVVMAFLIPVGLAIVMALREVLTLLGDNGLDILPHERIKALTEWLRPKLDSLGVKVSSEDDLLGFGPRLRQAALSAGTAALRSLTAVLSATPRALFNIALALSAWLVFAVDGKELRAQALPFLIPWRRERELISRVTAEVLRSLILANLLVSAVQAVLCTAALGILRVPRFFLFGVLSFFLSFIPVVGTTVVTLGAAVYLLTQGRVGSAIAMGVVAIVVGTVDNLLRPFFMRGQVELSFFWIFVALLGGIASFGLPGTVLGPLVFALCIATRRAYDEAVARREGTPLA